MDQNDRGVDMNKMNQLLREWVVCFLYLVSNFLTVREILPSRTLCSAVVTFSGCCGGIFALRAAGLTYAAYIKRDPQLHFLDRIRFSLAAAVSFTLSVIFALAGTANTTGTTPVELYAVISCFIGVATYDYCVLSCCWAIPLSNILNLRRGDHPLVQQTILQQSYEEFFAGVGSIVFAVGSLFSTAAMVNMKKQTFGTVTATVVGLLASASALLTWLWNTTHMGRLEETKTATEDIIA